jgi:hypothetical protein
MQRCWGISIYFSPPFSKISRPRSGLPISKGSIVDSRPVTGGGSEIGVAVGGSGVAVTGSKVGVGVACSDAAAAAGASDTAAGALPPHPAKRITTKFRQFIFWRHFWYFIIIPASFELKFHFQ